MTVLGDKFNVAEETKRNDVRTFVWKGAKEEINGVKVQNEIRLMDATPEQLQKFYDHCRSMLYNTTSKEHPGRYVLLNMIKEQREKCNTELYLRFLEKEDLLNHRPKYPRINYLQDLRASLNLEENKKNWAEYRENREKDREQLFDILLNYDISISEQLGDPNVEKMRKML